jgi:hypothetical protein
MKAKRGGKTPENVRYKVHWVQTDKFVNDPTVRPANANLIYHLMPKLVTCSKCSKPFSANISACPQCGYDAKREANLRWHRPCKTCGQMLPVLLHTRIGTVDSGTRTYKVTLQSPCTNCYEPVPFIEYTIYYFIGLFGLLATLIYLVIYLPFGEFWSFKTLSVGGLLGAASFWGLYQHSRVIRPTLIDAKKSS